jgi:hypothetical protein
MCHVLVQVSKFCHARNQILALTATYEEPLPHYHRMGQDRNIELMCLAYVEKC